MGQTESAGGEYLPLYPKNEYDPEMAKTLMDVARTYMDHADALIYSGAGKTFLSGYDLFDPDYGGRGNIDCSSLILLTLTGIPYERSPYTTGTLKGLGEQTALWADPALTDFDSIPERYMSMTERLGRPDLSSGGYADIDLDKAKASGINWDEVFKEMRGKGMIRRASQLAEYYFKRGECFSDPDSLRPGDLVFFKASSAWREGYQYFRVFHAISHIGMVWDVPGMMINSAGYQDKNRALAEGLPAVSLAKIFDYREVDMFARPYSQRGNRGV